VLLLLDTANVVPSSPILVTLFIKAIRFSETSVLTRFKQRNIPENGILKLSKYAEVNKYNTFELRGLTVVFNYTKVCGSATEAFLKR
jgi:hypothetical protein